MKRIRLAQRRKAVGLSQERLAELLGVDSSTIRRWERADTDPQPWHRPNLAKALAVSLDELDGMLVDTTSIRNGGPSAPLGVVVSVGPHQLGDLPDDLAALHSFRLADRQVGGGHLYATVTGYLQHTVAPRLFGMGRTSEDGGLFAAAAGLTEMAGWMAHDAGRDTAAEQHFQRALGLSAAGNDAQLGAHVFASLSHLSHHNRCPDRAVYFARLGRARLAAGQPHPGIQSRLFAMEARGHALLRQSEQCTERLHRAERALDIQPHVTQSPWVSQFDHAALAADAARCFRELGQLGSAKRYAEQVVAFRSADRPRSRAFAQLMLVSVLIDQGQIDEACAVAGQVLDAIRALSSFLVLDQLGQLGRALTRHRRAPEVAVFLGLLREELSHQRSMQWFPAQGTNTNG